jgi:hypothetical protein
VLQKFKLEILTVSEREVGCNHVIREFKFGILTSGQPRLTEPEKEGFAIFDTVTKVDSLVRVTPYSLVPNRTRSARSPVRRPGRCCEQKKGTRLCGWQPFIPSQ